VGIAPLVSSIVPLELDDSNYQCIFSAMLMFVSKPKYSNRAVYSSATVAATTFDQLNNINFQG